MEGRCCRREWGEWGLVVQVRLFKICMIYTWQKIAFSCGIKYCELKHASQLPVLMKNVGENTKLETALPVYHLTHVSSRYKIKSSSFFFVYYRIIWIPICPVSRNVNILMVCVYFRGFSSMCNVRFCVYNSFGLIIRECWILTKSRKLSHHRF